VDKYYVFPKVPALPVHQFLGDGSELKLRAAYGETGGQPPSARSSPRSIRRSWPGQRFQDHTAASNPISPERLKEIEVGIDGSALNGRL
jgi:hypothetical protein